MKTAESVQRILRGAQTDVLMAERSLDPGEALPQSIKKAIIACDLFLLLWSRNSKESEWVRHEVGIADGRNKLILPAVLDRRAKLPPPLQHIKYLPTYKDPARAFRWLEKTSLDAPNRNGSATDSHGSGSARLSFFLATRN